MKEHGSVMIRYTISGLCILSGAYLAGTGASGWPWFLVSGVFMFMTAAGAEVRLKQ